jgi:hypothetical protein
MHQIRTTTCYVNGHSTHYDNMAEFADAAEATASQTIRDARDDFRDYTSFDEALRMAREGWAAKAETIQTTVQRTQEVPVLTPEWDVTGDEVNVAMFLEGIPECMVSYPLRPQGRPVVEVFVSLMFAGSTPTEVVTMSGLALVGAVRALQTNGHTVIVTGVIANEGRGPGERMVHTVTLADTRYPYDEAILLYAVAHPDHPSDPLLRCPGRVG